MSHLNQFLQVGLVLLLSLSSFSVFLVCATDTTETATTSPADYQALVDWITSAPNGYVNPHQEYRLKENGHYGMFATAPIKQGDTFYSIPWSLVVTGGPEPYSALHCKTIQLLVEEFKKETPSSPYMAHLKSLPTHVVPSTWSDTGKDIFELICGYDQLPPAEPVVWIDKDFRNDCKGKYQDAEAAMLVLSKGDDDVMVPLHDLYAHRNGRYTNADTNVEQGKFHALVATRDIEQGEEICLSLNQCKDCDDRRFYGTPELLRDYGFVEDYPQTYFFDWLDFGFGIDKHTNEEGQPVYKIALRNKQPPVPENIAFLQAQLLRLKTVVQPELQALPEESIPAKEWNVLASFLESMVIALTTTIQAAGASTNPSQDACLGSVDSKGTCLPQDGYDDLQEYDVRFNNYQSYCDNYMVEMQPDSMKLVDREGAVEVQSPYQLLTFIENDDDKCLELDDMLQICTSFRPHYHDYVTHFAARYKEEIKRVVFVGGGDSMVLHEMLKYPNIELIVGLELDQVVVRESMKQFRTSPHFDDERVQWWFGDATKSLLMLPKEYFGSFDVVMVDLSESIMSYSVIKHVDIMEALALLLKPDGIMIKNDLHFRKMSDIFDYTIQMTVTDVPIICEQAFVLGSNTVDFLRPDIEVLRKGHDGVEIPLLEPVTKLSDSFKFVQKYRKNNAREQGKCDDLVTDSDVKLKRAGLFMVVEAEHADGPLVGDELETALKAALEKEWMTLISTVSNESETGGQHVVLVMKEGVVVARTWPEKKYCAFDLHLWGKFNKMDDLRNSLAAAVGSAKGSVSSFRIVVGGMRGTESWKHDKKRIGPKILQHRDCEKHQGGGVIDESVMDVVVEESLTLIKGEDPVVAVICGSEKLPCRSLDLVKASNKVKAVIPLWTCEPIVNVEFMGDGPLRMAACELETLKKLRENVSTNSRISGLILDVGTPYSMGKVVNSILGNSRHQDQLLTFQTLIVAPSGGELELWQTSFLDRCRVKFLRPPHFRAEVTLDGKDEQSEFAIFSSGNPSFFGELAEFADAVSSRTGVSVLIPEIVGAPSLESDAYNPKHFTTDDYDLSHGEAQFKEQQPLGHHVVSQLKMEQPPDKLIAKLSAALNKALLEAKFDNVDIQFFGEMGDGVVAVALAPQGTGIAVWDGNQRITFNLFAFDSDNATAGFQTFTTELDGLTVISRDEQPRGIGKVINFARDLV